jgi:hypothetical protein
LGGGLLLAFNAAVLFQVIRYAVRSSGVDQRIVAAAGAIFVVEAVQIAVHVGLESPRYLAVYALSVGFARATSQALRSA